MEYGSRRNRLLEVLSGKAENYLYPLFWQHGDQKEVLEEYVEKIKESGCGAFCVESRPHPDFLGEGWWRDLGILLGKAEELGMKVWILDDSHFPTGYAGGRVKEAPENLRQWFLRHREMDIPGPVDGKIAIGPFSGERQGIVGDGEQLVSAVLVKRCGGKDFASDGRFWNLTGQVRDGWLLLKLPKGQYRLYVIVRCRGEEGPFADYIDMTNPESVKILLAETYEKHYQHFGHEFGRTITGFFSDEPGFYNSDHWSGYSFRCQIGADMRIPWNPYISQAFQEKLKKEKILKKALVYLPKGDVPGSIGSKEESRMQALLPCLWFPCGEYTEEIRAAYMDVLTTPYQENFTGQLAAWCRQHGVEYVGHVIEDNNAHCRLGSGPGHYFRAVGGQDIAGIDVVLQQVLPGQDYLQFGMSSRGVQDGAFQHYGLGKLGASLAHQALHTRGRAMCEIYGAYGWAEGIGRMKWLADHMLVRGINLFVPHAFSEKAFPDPDCPPHFYAHGHNPQYPYIKELFPYMNRMCHLLSGGKPMIRVGVLYHGESEWLGRSVYFHTIGQVLMQHQIDYDVVWMDQLEHAVAENGVIKSGLLEITCLLIPLADRYPDKVKVYVADCAQKGVQVYQVLDELPGNSREGELWDFSDDREGERLINCIQIGLDQLADTLYAKAGELHLEAEGQEDAAKWLRYYHYIMEDGRHCYMLFQESMTEGICGWARLPVMECLKRYDGMANRLYQVSCHGERFFLKLFPGEAAVYLAGRPDSVSAQEEHESTYRNMDAAIQADLGTWQTPDCIVRISLAEYRNPETFYMVEDVENALLSQTHSIPLDFSGMIRYETEWDMTGEELGILHLGQCREAARVWVNGRDVGVRMGYPYYYEMADAWVPGRNRIRVEVPTTLAHALCDCFSRNMVVVSEGLDGPMQFK